MAWTNIRKAIVAGAVAVVLVNIGIMVVFLLRRDPEQDALERGRRAITKHLATPFDLASYYTTPASAFDNIRSFSAWSAVPRGFHTFANVPLQIDGMMCLWGDRNAKMGAVFPEQFTGIEIHRKFETLYLYHASFFAAPKGTPVAELVFRYADDSSATNQIRYGRDVLDWWADPGKNPVGPSAPRSKLAWHGEYTAPGKTQALRFCLTAIENLNPSLEVTSIDLYSSKSSAAECILAMTTGKSGLMK